MLTKKAFKILFVVVVVVVLVLFGEFFILEPYNNEQKQYNELGKAKFIQKTSKRVSESENEPPKKIPKKLSMSKYFDCNNIPPPDIDPLDGLNEEEKRVVKLRNKYLTEVNDQARCMCKRFHNRRKTVFGSGTKKTVKVFLNGLPEWEWVHLQLPYLQNCSVPCVASNSEKSLKDYDVMVYHQYVNYFGIEEKIIFKGNQKRPYVAMISNENGQSPDRKFCQFVTDSTDILIHNTPYSDIPTFLYSQEVKMFYDDNALKQIDLNYNFSDPVEYKKRFLEIYEKKKKDVLAVDMISFCKPNTIYRKEFLNYLEKYIKTDNYGKCGYSNCGYGNCGGGCNCARKKGYSGKLKDTGRGQKNRFLVKFDIFRDYLFAIVPENSIGYNYLTEKLRDALRSLYTIPIYFGAPNAMDFYSEDVRKKGFKLFIDANEFQKPSDLVNYVNYLASNKTAYMEYFQWRFEGYNALRDSNFPFVHSTFNENGKNIGWICRLCEKLYHGERVQHSKMPDFSHFSTEVNWT